MVMRFKAGQVVRQKNGQLFKILGVDNGDKSPLTPYYIIVPLPNYESYDKAVTIRAKNAHRRFQPCPEGEVLFG